MVRTVLDLADRKPCSDLSASIRRMTASIADVLAACKPSIYLYGSVAMDDFRPGWSDIDLLVLTQQEIPPEAAETLVGLRQTMLAEEPDNPFYRSFEGAMLPLDAFLSEEPSRVVYWGTSGQRITDRYRFDSFCMQELLTCGVLLHGGDVRGLMRMPDVAALRRDIQAHYETIRQYGSTTGRSLYTYGWLLDISRCLYTLKTGRIIGKTAAAQWALGLGLCPVPDALADALRVRQNPAKWKEHPGTWERAEMLGDDIQRYADALERMLRA